MISFVLVARNDDYGGDFRLRLQRCVNVLLPLIEKHRLEAEVVIVEWNPPHEKELLKDAVLWPPSIRTIPVRIIMVPGIIHTMIPASDRMGMFEFIAKNVGVRRAKGDYVIVTNPDILFSEELIETLARIPLSEDCFYRVDRYDFDGQVPPHGPAELLLKLAKQCIHTVHIRQTDVCGANTFAVTDTERLSGIKYGIWPGTHTGFAVPDTYHQLVINDGLGPYGGLHTNASGDFLLASREAWAAMRGFPEFVDTFTHMDSYACHQLAAIGLKQLLLAAPCMLLHQDHHRNENKNRPRHNQSEWLSDLEMLRTKQLRPAINPDTWGLGDMSLAEFLYNDVNENWQINGNSSLGMPQLTFFTRHELLTR